MRSPTILIVDDDATFVTFLEQTLERAGFSVITASDGCEVPDTLAAHHVDVLMLDLQMPGVNGWEVIRGLREPHKALHLDRYTARPKVVVVSGRDEEDTAAFVRRLGADAYLTKPCWGDQILATVRQVLTH